MYFGSVTRDGRAPVVSRRTVLCGSELGYEMDLLERIWELLQAFFGGILGSFERAMTSLFGSSNARYIKKLQAQVEAIGALEPKY